jgi:threonine aldolase
MDGARFANAVAALDCTPADITWKAGIDVMSLGATKCGALAAEAVVFFNPDSGRDFALRRKRGGHLVSKGRLFGAQFVGWLKDGHWLELARHANGQARRLAEKLAASDTVRLQWPGEANELFVTMPAALAHRLLDAGAEFYQWPGHGLPPGVALAEDEVFVRLVTSFVTTDDHIDRFCAIINNHQQAAQDG